MQKGVLITKKCWTIRLVGWIVQFYVIFTVISLMDQEGHFVTVTVSFALQYSATSVFRSTWGTQT